MRPRMVMAGALAVATALTTVACARTATTQASFRDVERSRGNQIVSEIPIVVTPGATRSLGFFRLHPTFARHIFEAHLERSADVGWTELTNVEDVLGVLWADSSRESDGTPRDDLGRARIALGRQLVAALLSASLDNGASLPVDGSSGARIDVAAREAIAGTDAGLMLQLAESLEDWIEASSQVEIELGDWPAIGPADRKGSIAIADLTAGDGLNAVAAASDTDDRATASVIDEPTPTATPAPTPAEGALP